MANILVVGGYGFIGSHLTQACLQRGDAVSVITFQRTQPSVPLTGSVRVIPLDLRDRTAVAKALRKHAFEEVYNLGGYIDHAPFFKGGRDVLDQHFLGVENLLSALDRSKLKAFVQVGSSDEYGSAPAPQREEAREEPIAPYSLGKAAAARLIQLLHRTEAFPGVAVRLFLVYGPGQEARRFIPQVIQGCLSGQPFPVSEGKQQRDFTYIDDVVAGLLAAASHPKSFGRVINLASGKPVTVRAVLEKLVQLCGGGTPQYGAVPYRAGENMALYADAGLAKSLLKWQPRVSLEEGLKRTIAFYRA